MLLFELTTDRHAGIHGSVGLQVQALFFPSLSDRDGNEKYPKIYLRIHLFFPKSACLLSFVLSLVLIVACVQKHIYFFFHPSSDISLFLVYMK